MYPLSPRTCRLAPALLALSCVLAACQQEQESSAPAEPATSTVATRTVAEPVVAPPPAATTVEQLQPLPGMEGQVPELTEKTTVNMQTTAGDVVIEIYPQAAPNAVARFTELVQSGFYDNTPVSRVVPGFVAQFGINWREPHNAWEMNHFDDDPTLFALERGTLAFAKSGINANSTQVFINYAENNRLAAPQYNFTVFGKVVSGMEVVDMFADVGEPGMGLDQGALWTNGEEYLASLPEGEQPTMITRASIVE